MVKVHFLSEEDEWVEDCEPTEVLKHYKLPIERFVMVGEPFSGLSAVTLSGAIKLDYELIAIHVNMLPDQEAISMYYRDVIE